jgi:hypothetical protein
MIGPTTPSLTLRRFLRPPVKTHQKQWEFEWFSIPAASIFLLSKPWESQVFQGFFIVALDLDDP